MVIFDRRSEFSESDSNLDTVAAEAHRLYENDDFEADLVDALGPVVKQHLDCEAVDAPAEEVLREWLAREGLGGLFQLRNQIVTNREADLAEGDVVWMESARSGDDQVIPYVVHSADPGETGVYAYRVDPDTGEYKHRDLSAGHVTYVDRFEVERSERGRSPFTVAQEIADQVTES